MQIKHRFHPMLVEGNKAKRKSSLSLVQLCGAVLVTLTNLDPLTFPLPVRYILLCIL